MKNVKKLLAGLLVSATLLAATLGVSAADSIETNNNYDHPMNTIFSKTTSNKAGYMYYHAGTIMLVDDAFAYTETKVTSGMTGYASVNFKAQNGTITTKYSEKIVNNSYIRTDTASVSGQTSAEYVRFTGARKDVGQDYVGFNYRIY